MPAADVAALADGTSYTVTPPPRTAPETAPRPRAVWRWSHRAGYQHKHGFNGRPTQRREQQQPLTLNGSTSAEVGQTEPSPLEAKLIPPRWPPMAPGAERACGRSGSARAGRTDHYRSVNDRAGNPGQTTHALTVDTLRQRSPSPRWRVTILSTTPAACRADHQRHHHR